jgi:hypothetical protein
VKGRALTALLTTGVLLGAALVWALLAQADSKANSPYIRGAGTTMLEGGTGPPSFTPVLTKVAFHLRRG